MQTASFKDIGLVEYKEAWDYQEKIFNECGQGATLSITTQPEESMTKVYFLIGVDKISDSITYSTNAFYKVEF